MNNLTMDTILWLKEFAEGDCRMLNYLALNNYDFRNWLNLSSEYNIPDIFETGEIHVPERIDKVYSVMAAIVQYYLKDPTKDKAIKLLNVIENFQRELQVHMLIQVKSKDPKIFYKIKCIDPGAIERISTNLFHLLI